MALCNELEVHHRLGGMEGALAMAQQRSGGAFDPDLVAAFCSRPAEILAAVERPSLWDDLLAAEPSPHRLAEEGVLIEAGRVMGDFADLKSTFLAGHSTRVAELAVAASQRVGIDPSERTKLTLGALAHNLGRVAISTAVWDKPGPLSDAEWERVRLHPYYSVRLLSRAPRLAAAAQLAGMHHERLDGSGYHRGCRAAAQPMGSRLIAAADAFSAMLQARAHRPASEPDAAASEMRRLAGEGRLDSAAVNAE